MTHTTPCKTAARPAWRATLPLLLVATTLLAAACGRGTPLGKSRLSSVGSAPFFVISGGYFSCKFIWSKPTDAATFTHAKAIMDTIAGALGIAVPYISSCFASSPESMRYTTESTSPTATPPDDYLHVVEERVAQLAPGTDVVLVGHSWGGYMMMDLAARLAGKAKVHYLETLDPISRVSCPPSVFIDSVLNLSNAEQQAAAGSTSAAPVTIGSSASPDTPGCTHAPTDLDTQRISQNVDRWHQFYQDRFAYLHSSAITAATVNTYLSYDRLSRELAWTAHAELDRDERVWSAIGSDWK